MFFKTYYCRIASVKIFRIENVFGFNFLVSVNCTFSRTIIITTIREVMNLSGKYLSKYDLCLSLHLQNSNGEVAQLVRAHDS